MDIYLPFKDKKLKVQKAFYVHVRLQIYVLLYRVRANLRDGSGILIKVLYVLSSLCSSMKCFSFLLTIQVNSPCFSSILNTAGRDYRNMHMLNTCNHGNVINNIKNVQHLIKRKTSDTMENGKICGISKQQAQESGPYSL